VALVSNDIGQWGLDLSKHTTKVILQVIHCVGPALLVDRWSRRWVAVPRCFLDLQLWKAPDGGWVHRSYIGSSTDPIVMSNSVGSQLHVGFGVLGNHDTSAWDRRIHGATSNKCWVWKVSSWRLDCLAEVDPVFVIETC
jgi:hypothetical protein